MYRYLERRFAQRILETLQRRHLGVTLPRVVIEQPPNVELGDFAIPTFPFAKPLRSAPLKIAEEIRDEIGTIEGIAEMQVAPPGYLNVRIDRAWLAAALVADQRPRDDLPPGKILVEHTSINPNKAAHIGHLRNAILGDTFVRLLRYAGREVDVQNYIDNTGVQVADVVVGFTHIEKKSRAEIESLIRREEIVVQPKYPAGLSTTSAGTSTPASRSGTSRTSRTCKPVWKPCTLSKTLPTRPPPSPTSSRPPSSAAISRPWTASTSNTTSSPAKAKSSTCISGTRPSRS